ncbi:hypothetical protein CS053_08210 [Rhodanobacter glycinis]|uniref:Uncharacterized protein n=1 Tax=Rhodanobacter glycinis TaxID=582702 RepID=A0A5B9DWV2_9GAMM|nr:hypothetical protein [Rhodanobacter glycinis]QEE24483.1 hypothetical protein CS053_08210 [Rhodanobacter glycinis]
MFTVTEKAQRPARMDGKCFYCQQAIGATHKDDCVLVSKKVVVRMIVEYEVEVPQEWNAAQVEFHRNAGSWCSNNAMRELEELQEAQGCLCHAARFEYVKDASEPYLSE